MGASEIIVDKQLNAYNTHDLKSFLECYHSKAVGIHLDMDKVLFSSKDEMRILYAELFKNKQLHCSIKNRMVLENIVVDNEHITHNNNGDSKEAVAMYYIGKSGLIEKVWFTNGG